MKSISQIESIGGIDADNDDLLISCFQNHNAFKDVVDFKRCIVIGRKGTGKTAIFKNILIDRNFDKFSFGHTFSDYPWHHHDVQVKMGVPDFERYVHSWKYLILITISKILLNEDQSIPYDDRSLDYSSKIERFIIDSYGSRNPDITQIFTPSKRLKIKPNLNVAGELISADISLE